MADPTPMPGFDMDKLRTTMLNDILGIPLLSPYQQSIIQQAFRFAQRWLGIKRDTFAHDYDLKHRFMDQPVGCYHWRGRIDLDDERPALLTLFHEATHAWQHEQGRLDCDPMQRVATLAYATGGIEGYRAVPHEAEANRCMYAMLRDCPSWLKRLWEEQGWPVEDPLLPPHGEGVIAEGNALVSPVGYQADSHA